MHVIFQIVKGNLYFRFKTVTYAMLVIKITTIHWYKIILLYEIRFQKFVDVDFFKLNTSLFLSCVEDIWKKSVLFELSTNNTGFDSVVENFGKGHE